MRGKNLFGFVLFVILSVGPSGAASAGETRLTLSQAIIAALTHNHEMLATGSALSAVEQDIGIARGFLLPQISFEERATRTNNPPGVFMSKLNQERFAAPDLDINALNDPAAINDFQSLVTIDQPIFIPRALIGLDMAKKEHAAKSKDYGRKKEETVFKVIQSYLQIQTAKEYVKAVQAGLEDAREQLRISEVRHQNNIGLYADVLRAKTSLIENEQRLVSARKNLSLAQRMLGLLVGSPDPVDSLDDPPAFTLRDLDHYQNASTSRKDILSSKIRSENAKQGIRLADSKYLPDLGIHGSYQLNDNNRPFGTDGKSWWLMGVLRWNLFDGGGREYEVRKARHKQMEADEQLKGLRQLVTFKIAEAHLEAQEAAQNTELAKSELASAQEGYKLVKRRFENALSPLVDLLQVQASLDQARAKLVARENEYRAAVMRLAFESGTIMADMNLDDIDKPHPQQGDAP